MKKRKKKVKKGGIFFRGFKGILKWFFKKPEFVYLGGKPDKSSVILCNHVGISGPLKLEMYFDENYNFRLWGTHEMTEGLISTYKYQSYQFYHKKKGWNLFASRVFCIFAAPVSNMFYKGLDLIPTYRDTRLKHTLKTSVEEIKKGKNIIIFPENSENGYQDILEGYHPGFALLCNQCAKASIDVPIYVTYYNKYTNTYVFDKPVMYSELVSSGLNKEEMSKKLCDRANELRLYVKPENDEQQN